MTVPERLKLNTPLVVSQQIEGETILINFDSGCYYSTNATGSAVLDLLAAGVPASQLSKFLGRHWQGEDAEIAAGVSAFLREGIAEALLVEGEPDTPGDPDRILPQAQGGFSIPRLERYDDLQDLLMLDPIHDVDAVGWPVPPPGRETPAPKA